jgi:hypothetical protein
MMFSPFTSGCTCLSQKNILKILKNTLHPFVISRSSQGHLKVKEKLSKIAPCDTHPDAKKVS